MTFVPKVWKDFPDLSTPITAAALIDLEQRVHNGSLADANWMSGMTGDGVADDSVIMQAQFNLFAGKMVFIPRPSVAYRWVNSLIVPDGTTVIAYGALIKPENEATAVEFGTQSRTPATSFLLTANPAVGDFAVTVSLANAAQLAVNQRVQLRDPTFTLGGIVNRRETNVIDAINLGTGVITLKYPIGHAYLTANSSTISPITMTQNVNWLGGEFDMSGVAGGIPADCNALNCNFPENCHVRDVTCSNHPSKAVAYYGGLHSTIEDCNGRTPSLVGPGQGYTCQLEYCRNSEIRDGKSLSCRHHADIVGGQHNTVRGGFITGRTTDFCTGADLHGMESRWCRIIGFTAVNVNFGVLAGNGTFDADYDFTFEDCHAYFCDVGMDVVQSANGRIRGGAVVHNNSGSSPVNIQNTAKVKIEGVEVSGTMLRGIYFSSTSTDHDVSNCKFRGVIAECIRAEAGEITVTNCDFGPTGITTAIRAATSCSRISQSGNYWGGVSFRIGNTSSAQIFGTSANETEGTTSPAAGAWLRGDRCWNTTPSAAGIPGWVCTTAGTPGTWKAMAVVAA